MKVHVEKVTPAIAKEWLKRNTVINRKLRENVVADHKGRLSAR